MKQKIGIVAIIVILLGVIIFVLSDSKGQVFGNITTGTTTSYSSSSVSTAATLIFDQKPSAQYRSITNRTGINLSIVCSSTSTGVIYGVGRILGASSTMELVEENGTMWCTDKMWGASAGASIVATQER